MLKFSVIMALGATLSWAVGDFLIQRVVRRVGNLSTAAWLGIIGSIGLFPFVINDLHQINSWNIFLSLALLGVLLTFNALFFGQSLKIGKLSIVEIVLVIELPITILFGVVFLKDSISFLQLSLIAALIIGILLSSINIRKVFKIDFFEKGTLLMIIAAIFLASMNLITAVSAKQMSPLVVIWFPWTMSSLILLIFIWFKKNIASFWKSGKEFRNLLILTGIVDIAAWVFYAFAVSRGELSITTALTESYPVLAIFLGIKFNKEKISKFQLISGATAIMISLILVLTIE